MAASVGSSSGSTRGRPLLLRLYPEAWRARYGVEFSDLLEARPPALRDKVDIVAGAIDARLHPQVGVVAPIDRVVNTADRWLALMAIAAGALFATWTSVVAFAAPRWGSSMALPEELVNVAYGAGQLAMILAIGVFLGLLFRYAGVLTTAGALGGLVSAGGFAVGIVASAGILAVVMLVVGSMVLAPWLARSIASWRIAIAFAVSTLALFVGLWGFEASGGQETRLFVLLLPYGPAWILLGRSLLRGGPPPLLQPAIA